MSKAYVVVGPARIGNLFGIFGKTVPEGRFAVVANGEYANGGYGPSQAGPQKLYTSHEEAERAASALNMVRVQYAVYSTREAALEAGYPDAELGTWQERPSSTKLVEGWIALDHPD